MTVVCPVMGGNKHCHTHIVIGGGGRSLPPHCMQLHERCCKVAHDCRDECDIPCNCM